MLTSSTNWGPELKELCKLILEASIKEEDKYQVGLSKIFFRAGMLAYMEKIRTDRLNYLVTLIQKNALRGYHQGRYQRLRKATIGVQTCWRRVQAKREADKRRRETAALQIQRITRGYLQRKQYLRTQRAVITLQSGRFCTSGRLSR
jgi:myosin-5